MNITKQSSRSDLDDLLALTDDIESQEKEKQSMFAKTQSTRLQSQSRTVSVKRFAFNLQPKRFLFF